MWTEWCDFRDTIWSFGMALTKLYRLHILSGDVGFIGLSKCFRMVNLCFREGYLRMDITIFIFLCFCLGIIVSTRSLYFPLLMNFVSAISTVLTIVGSRGIPEGPLCLNRTRPEWDFQNFHTFSVGGTVTTIQELSSYINMRSELDES